MTKFGFICINLVAVMAACQELPALEAQQLAPHVFLLKGEGGNILLSRGRDGLFLVDCPYETLFNGTGIELKGLRDDQVRFIANTHWHADHMGGNEAFAKRGATIIAHDNVRHRLSHRQYNAAFDYATPPAAKDARPTLTYDKQLVFHLNDLTIRVVHAEAAHTDGDSIVFFEEANVVHLGDLFMSDSYPVVDTYTGGTLNGMIAALEGVLERVDSEAKIVPGHGPVSDKAGLSGYLQMLKSVRKSMGQLVGQGKTLEQIKAAKPLDEHHDQWGGGIVSSDLFLTSLYPDFVGKNKP